MATINLLPWRQERREQLKKEFLVISAGFAALAAAIILSWQMLLSNSIANQESRNRYLEEKIRELDLQVKEIAELRAEKQKLVERMKVIQSLQGNRPEIVHVFDELVRTLPDGVFYTLIDRKADVITLNGTAESNNRVSSLMRELDASEWFSNPTLKMVKANPRVGDQATDFNMTLKITPPAAEEVSSDGKPGQKK